MVQSRSYSRSHSKGKIAIKTNPKLWEKLKHQVLMGDKGGEPGKFSARKAQLLVHLYKSKGGSFKGRKSPSNSLSKWSKEKWGYISRSGEKTKKGRYLPLKVRQSLTSEEKKRENRRKGSRRGEWVSYSKSVVKKMHSHKII
jgi:hypothetical protein